MNPSWMTVAVRPAEQSRAMFVQYQIIKIIVSDALSFILVFSKFIETSPNAGQPQNRIEASIYKCTSS